MSAANPSMVVSSPGQWAQWFGDPITAILLLALAAWYLDGFVRIRGQRDGWPASSLRTASFFGGLAVATLTLLSPLDALGYRLFSAHMAQHLLLIVVVAPLLAWSEAHRILAIALPGAVQRRLVVWLARPSIAKWYSGPQAAWAAAGAFSVTVWFWHVPAAHDAALASLSVHAIEHLTVLITATMFWRVILTSGKRRVSPGLAAAIVSLVSLQGSLLSAILMFSPVSLCRSYAGNPLDDQVLAGLLMCIPASFVYVGSTVWALSRLLSNGPTHAR